MSPVSKGQTLAWTTSGQSTLSAIALKGFGRGRQSGISEQRNLGGRTPTTIMAMALVTLTIVTARAEDIPTGHNAFISLDRLTETRERPLFAPTRRAPQVAPPAVIDVSLTSDAPTLTPPNAALTGVIIGQNTRLAIVHLASSGKNLALRQGDQIEGWTIAEVKPHSIGLRNGQDQVDLVLKACEANCNPDAQAATPQPAVAAPPPQSTLPPQPTPIALPMATQPQWHGVQQLPRHMLPKH